jgi:hypothetical protein
MVFFQKLRQAFQPDFNFMTERQEGMNMARLPVDGSDVGNWGALLNSFLRVGHNEDGTIKSADIWDGKYSKPATGINRTDMSADVQAALGRAEVALVSVPVITKQDIGLGNVTNEAQLPLTGGTLTGSLRVNGGNTLRAYHTDNTKYIELKADAFWSRIAYGGGTSGVVMTGPTIMIEASTQTVLNTPSMRPNTHLGTTLGAASYYYSSMYLQRHYFNASAYLDGATAGVIGVSDGASLGLGTTTGTKIGTAASQKLAFFGATPAIQPTGGASTAAASYSTNEQAMLNKMWTALRTLGLMN